MTKKSSQRIQAESVWRTRTHTAMKSRSWKQEGGGGGDGGGGGAVAADTGSSNGWMLHLNGVEHLQFWFIWSRTKGRNYILMHSRSTSFSQWHFTNKPRLTGNWLVIVILHHQDSCQEIKLSTDRSSFCWYFCSLVSQRAYEDIGLPIISIINIITPHTEYREHHTSTAAFCFSPINHGKNTSIKWFA